VRRGKPELKTQFTGVDGQEWRIFHAPARKFPGIFKDGKRWVVGKVYFGGKRKGKIYIDSEQPEHDKLDTTIHELVHVAMRDLGLDQMIEEEFVEKLSSRLAFYLDQISR